MFERNRARACLGVFLLLVFLLPSAFGQGTGASLTGTVQDASGGVLPGATVIARNVDTGVETRTTSNNTGSYTFPSLPISGAYEIIAEAPGFSRAVRSNVRLNVGGQSRLDLTLAVAGTITEVEVTGAAESVILEAGSSTGTVMQEETLASIPMLSNNIMDLINTMGGVTPATDPVFGASSQTFAGVSAAGINVTRDGMAVGEVRFSTGITASTNINTEMVGEFRMVLSPVDAEMGRGAGQVQMTTKSGSNAFHGSGVWNIQNTALDAEDFSNKFSGTPASWRNLNSYMLTASGPIIKNRTFFFVTWEQQFSRSKSPQNTKVLTPCARKGIYRYLSNVVPGAVNANGTYSEAGGIITRPSVDANGFPLEVATFNHNQTNVPMDFNNPLQVESIFGDLSDAARAWLLNPSNKGGAYGNCEDVTFTPTLGGTNTSSFYSIPTVNNAFRGNYWTGDFTPAGGAYRHAYDATGFVDRYTFGADYGSGRVEMPPVNNYTAIGDGLNYANHRWIRTLIGEGGSIWGTGGDPDRKSITFKLDHNVNNDHRLSGTYTYEDFFVDDAYAQWPEQYGGYGGGIFRRPQTFLVSLTSTLRPTVLNEARFGLSRTNTYTNTALKGPNGSKMREVLDTLLPPQNNQSLLVGVGEIPILFHTDPQPTPGANPSHPFGSRGNIPGTWGGNDPRWTIADTITWMKGSHSFKGGVEYRRQSSTQEFDAVRAFAGTGGLSGEPSIFGGANTGTQQRRRGALGSSSATINGDAWLNVAGGYVTDPSSPNFGKANQDNGTTVGGNFSIPYAMMTYFSGTVAQMRQYFFISPNDASRWNDATAGEDEYSFAMTNQEISFFFKDDWKISNSLTLNLGVRYEYYGVPYVHNGRTLGLRGGSANVYGVTQHRNFQDLMSDRKSYYVQAPVGIRTSAGGILFNEALPTPVTMYEYRGPDSANADVSAWNKDRNNFAPHLGFAWQLPWFGKGLTTLRGGWSVSYSPVNNFDQYGVQIADVAAANLSRVETFNGIGSNATYGDSAYYMDLTDLNGSNAGYSNLLPMAPPSTIMPLAPFQVGAFQSSATVIDENIRNPYTHSFNMSLTRNIGRSLVVDVRYIGTLGRDQVGSLDLNANDYIRNNLYSELEIVRQGGESKLINSLITENAFTNGSGLTGSQQLRSTRFGGVASNLAVGNFAAVAGTLATTSGQLTTDGTATLIRSLRAGCLPEHRTNPGASAATIGDNVGNPCTQGTPWNYLRANPQFGSTGFNYNASMSNYHSLQTQVTLRPTKGLNFQATYTWSRLLTDSGWTNYLGERNYMLSGQHRSHSLNTYGSYELPLGARGFFLRDASGVLKKAIEGWQLSWVTSMSTGAPTSVTGANSLWSNSWPILVRPDLWDDKAGKTTEIWEDGRFRGARYLGNQYTKVLDTNICRAPGTTGGLDQTLYNTYCVGTNGAIQDAAQYALALATTDASGNVIPATYTSDYTATDGRTYAAGTPIIVMRNADQREGENAAGTYKANRLTGQGRFSFDMAMSKSIEFMEGKRLEIRVDAQNILNHATATNGTAASYGGRFYTINSPSFAMNTSPTTAFGNMTTKAGHRTFQARLALRF